MDISEVWFSGYHMGALFSLYYLWEAHDVVNLDIGGGCIPDTEHPSLTQIMLWWTVKEIKASQCGIEFDNTALSHHDISTSPDVNEPNSDGYTMQVRLEAIQPIHNSLFPKEWPLFHGQMTQGQPHSFKLYHPKGVHSPSHPLSPHWFVDFCIFWQMTQGWPHSFRL